MSLCCSFSLISSALALQGTDTDAGLAVAEVATEPTFRSPIKNQPRSTSLFTGRQDHLDALTKNFTDQGPGQHLRREYLLFGMGGAGKTQIALKFAESHQQKQVY